MPRGRPRKIKPEPTPDNVASELIKSAPIEPPKSTKKEKKVKEYKKGKTEITFFDKKRFQIKTDDEKVILFIEKDLDKSPYAYISEPIKAQTGLKTVLTGEYTHYNVYLLDEDSKKMLKKIDDIKIIEIEKEKQKRTRKKKEIVNNEVSNIDDK